MRLPYCLEGLEVDGKAVQHLRKRGRLLCLNTCNHVCVCARVRVCP